MVMLKLFFAFSKIPFFDYPDDIRKAIYMTNAIESFNRSLRKVKGAIVTFSGLSTSLMYESQLDPISTLLFSILFPTFLIIEKHS